MHTHKSIYVYDGISYTLIPTTEYMYTHKSIYVYDGICLCVHLPLLHSHSQRINVYVHDKSVCVCAYVCI